METEAHVLDTLGNYSLVRWDGRRFPGLLIQGDTLRTVLEALEEAVSELEKSNVEDAGYAIRSAQETIQDMSLCYEDMMAKIGLKLPYYK